MAQGARAEYLLCSVFKYSLVESSTLDSQFLSAAANSHSHALWIFFIIRDFVVSEGSFPASECIT